MRTIGDTIKLLREERRISQQQLADFLKVGRSTISMYESGARIPDDNMKGLICDFFNVDMNYLFGKTNTRNSYREDTISKPSNVVEIPLYSSISCGTGLFVDDNIDDYIAVPNRFVKSNKNYFANYASGDSMIGKGIQNGDVLVFEQTQILDNGQIGAFCINDENAVCKTFRKLSNGIVLLESANSAYDPIEIDVMKDDCFRIIGRLVGSFKKF